MSQSIHDNIQIPESEETVSYNGAQMIFSQGDGLCFQVFHFEPGDETITIHDAHTKIYKKYGTLPVLSSVDQNDVVYFGSSGGEFVIGKEPLHSPIEVSIIMWQLRAGIANTVGLPFNQAMYETPNVPFNLHINKPETKLYFEGPKHTIAVNSIPLLHKYRPQTIHANNGPGSRSS